MVNSVDRHQNGKMVVLRTGCDKSRTGIYLK